MKRVVGVLLFLAVFGATFFSCAAGRIYKSGYYSYVLTEDETAIITRYNGMENILKIPLKIGNYQVSGIGDFAFEDCFLLTTVSIPDNVLSIGSNPWKEVFSLVSISISPEHPTLAIIDKALYSKPDKRLIWVPIDVKGKFEIPQGIQIIGNSAFYNNTNLTSIVIPDSVITIEDNAFQWCSKLSELSIPSSVTTIGDNAYTGCSKLKTLSIPEGLTHIGTRAFSSCVELDTIEIPNSVISIGKEAFVYCYKLTIIVNEGSYAEKYCIDNGLPYTYKNISLDWLND